MPTFEMFQPNKQQNTAIKQAPPNRQVKPPSTRPTTLLPSKYKVLDNSFLCPASDDGGIVDGDSDEYELSDDELLDYGRPGRRRAAKEQGLISEPFEDEEKRSSEVKGTKESAEVLQENKGKLNLKGKTNVTQKKPGWLDGLRK